MPSVANTEVPSSTSMNLCLIDCVPQRINDLNAVRCSFMKVQQALLRSHQDYALRLDH